MSQTFEPGDGHRSFSVVVCTRNRARFLEATLDSVLAQEYPRDRYELVIVDNGSSDGTRALVERYLTTAPIPVSFHLEPQLGASFARNLGTERARHEYIAFLDDDTVAVPGWLAAYDAAIRGHGAVAAGGPVEPALEPGFEPPAWWSDPRIRSIFGLDHTDPDPDERVVTIRWPLWLGCCNSIYSKRLLRFRTDCGPMGPRYRVAQDTDLNVRLERAGVPIHYVRDARIRHRITADRLSRRFLLRRAYAAGMTNAAAWALLDARSGAAGVKQPRARRCASLPPASPPERRRRAHSRIGWAICDRNRRSRFRGGDDPANP
jgi:glucosyl-dolichyl phosphate glucuronosyltransferase